MIKRLAIIALLAVSGCSGMAIRAKTELIGMKRADIISCAGVPDKTETLPDREILQYQQDQPVQGPLDFKGPMSLELSVGGHGTCHAVLTLREGVVSSVGYTGQAEHCSAPMQLVRLF